MTIKVYWNPVSLELKGYSVKYWTEKEGQDSAAEINVPKTTHSLLIERLKYFTVYVVQVTALVTGEVIRGQAKISTEEEGMIITQPCCLKFRVYMKHLKSH